MPIDTQRTPGDDTPGGDGADRDAAAPDGTDQSDTPDLGDLVVDQEDDDPDLAAVVNSPPVPLDEWRVYYSGDEEVTVADENPGYDATTTVSAVVFLDDLARLFPEWRPSDGPLPIADLGERYYAFPPGRLDVVGRHPEDVDDEHAEAFADQSDQSVEEDTDQSDPTPEDLPADLAALRDRLANRSPVGIERGPDGPVLVFEKLGDEYRIAPTGEVEGDGAARGPLVELVGQYLD